MSKRDPVFFINPKADAAGNVEQLAELIARSLVTAVGTSKPSKPAANDGKGGK